jgi:SNF2 family DNA or RNA helicase
MMELIRRLDALEDQARDYVTLDEAQRETNADLSQAIAENVVVVDYRRRPDGTPVILCRLNRHHPTVKELTSWS